MLTFSTDDLRPHERFDYWCEVRARNLFGVTISLKQEERQHFRGQFSARPASGAILSQMQASPYKVSRTASDISRASSDSLASISRPAAQAGSTATPAANSWCGPASSPSVIRICLT